MTKADARLIQRYAAFRGFPWRPLADAFEECLDEVVRENTRAMMLDSVGPEPAVRVTRDGGKTWEGWN